MERKAAAPAEKRPSAPSAPGATEKAPSFRTAPHQHCLNRHAARRGGRARTHIIHSYTLPLQRRQSGKERDRPHRSDGDRSEEHTSELQSLMRISYAVFCLKKKKKKTHQNT